MKNPLRSLFAKKLPKQNTAGLHLEQLEERQMLSTVAVFAQGSIGDEVLEVRVRGRVLATVDNLPTDGFAEIQVETGFDVDPGEVSVFFTNDLYDPANGIDRNVTVDRIEVDGNIYQTENAATFSSGTWRPEDGIVGGLGRGETLNGNGFFRYSSAGFDGVANTTLIEIDAEASVTQIPGAPPAAAAEYELQIDGQTVQQYTLTSEAGFNRATRTYRAQGDVSPDRIRVAFTNDIFATDPNTGQTIDRNLTVHSVTVDGFSYNGADSNVFSTGTWRPEDGITSGFGRGNILNGNGFFQFGGQQQTTQIEINARGFGDVVDFELQIDGQAVQNYSLSAHAGASQRTFVFQADGVVTPDRVRIAFTNDRVLTISGARVDRNLQIAYVGIGDQFFDPRDSNVFSTGTYLAEDGVSPGFGRGNILHSNGYFQFG